MDKVFQEFLYTSKPASEEKEVVDVVACVRDCLALLEAQLDRLLEQMRQAAAVGGTGRGRFRDQPPLFVECFRGRQELALADEPDVALRRAGRRGKGCRYNHGMPLDESSRSVQFSALRATELGAERGPLETFQPVYRPAPSVH